MLKRISYDLFVDTHRGSFLELDSGNDNDGAVVNLDRDEALELREAIDVFLDEAEKES